MNLHLREDLVHGSQGDTLRSTAILISGDGAVGAALRMLFAKAGYRNLTLVMDEYPLTDEGIRRDALLKREDAGSSRLQATRKRFEALSTAEALSLRIIDRARLAPSDLDGNRFIIMADSHDKSIEAYCRGRMPMIYGISTPTGFRVDFFPNGTEAPGYPPVGPSAFLPSQSLMAAAHMMSLVQKLTLENQDMHSTTHFHFPDTYNGPDELVGDLVLTDPSTLNRVREISIAVVGCGAIGSHVTQLLAANGFPKVTLIEFDEIRAHNLSRLALAEASDIGKNKASMLSDRVRERYRWHYTCIDQEVEYIPEGRMIDHDMILCCTDRMTARRYLAGISRLKKNLIFVQGGFGGSLYQITTGTEIESIFNQSDTVRNSCTGLNMYEDPSVPVGATQATVAMVSACMVYAAQRILQGATTLKDRFFTWGFPDRVLPLELATSEASHSEIREIVIPDGGTPVRELLQKVDEHFPGHYMLIEHPFIIEWDCLGGCGKPISIGRYHHHLSDSDRFHDACLKGNEHLLHLNMSQPQLAVSDRLSLESDDRILSLSVQEIGLMEDSIRRICCKDGRLAAIRIKYGLPKHSSLILNETALIDMTSHGMETAKSSGHEAAGLLFGHVTGDQVHVTTFVPAEVETSTPYYVQISSEWMARILYEYEDSSLSLCGWWHSHPGFGLRPSSRDIETFAYFSGKNHFSLIQDPTATDYALAVYQYSEGEVVSRDFRLKSKDGRMIKYKRTT